MGEKTVTLYPGNWLYNASVIGFLKVLYFLNLDVDNFLKEDGTVMISLDLNPQELFEVWNKLTQHKLNISYKGKTGGTKNYYYANQTESSIKEKLTRFLYSDIQQEYKKAKEKVCIFCGKKELSKESEIKPLTQSYSRILIGGVDNYYWNIKPNDYVCKQCQFILMCHHLAFTKLIDSSEIFINTPSFKIMWYLNKYAQEVYEKEKAKTTKEILGISLIEMSSKLYVQLGKWILMNIDVITKHNEDRLDFFSLPYEVLLVISDREIASLLNNIGEQSILNLVLDGDFKNIIEIGREILKLGLKPKGERKKQKDFINKIIKINKNLENMTSFSQKLFKLYALIEEKLKGGILV